MIMKKYIFLIVTVVCLFACKDGDEVRQTTSPEASFSIDKDGRRDSRVFLAFWI